eukprot:125419-Pleurochrysis_carterae.AAC.1
MQSCVFVRIRIAPSVLKPQFGSQPKIACVHNCISRHKVQLVQLSQRPTFADYMRYLGDRLLGRTVVLVNMDVFIAEVRNTRFSSALGMAFVDKFEDVASCTPFGLRLAHLSSALYNIRCAGMAGDKVAASATEYCLLSLSLPPVTVVITHASQYKPCQALRTLQVPWSLH